MATSTANRGGAAGDKTGGGGVAKLDDKLPAMMTPPEAGGGGGSSGGMGAAMGMSGVGIGIGMGGMDMDEIFQWKWTRSSWRLAAAGIGGGGGGGGGGGSSAHGPAVSRNGGIGGMSSLPAPPGPGVAGTGIGSGAGASSGTAGGGAPLINAHHRQQHHQNHHQNHPPAGSLGVAAAAAIERPLHTVLGPGRITKTRHRPSTAASLVSSTSSAAVALKKSLGSTSSSAAIAAALGASIGSTSTATMASNGSSRHHHYPAKADPTNPTNSTTASAASNSTPQKTLSTLDLIEMDNPVLSFWGPDLVPLPPRFARIKRNLIAGHEPALEASWARLVAALGAEVEHIEGLGSHLIPSVEFSDLGDAAQTSRFGRDLRRYGVGVVRGVVPRADADDAVRETVRYVQRNHGSRPPPLTRDPTCYDFFWTPAQVRTRAHPSVLRAQRFMMGLWSTAADDRLVTKYPIAYADRIRIHAPPMAGATAGTAPSSSSASPSANPPGSTGTPHHHSSNGLPGPPVRPPKSADDWLGVIQSSGVIAQVDNGSLERWEPDGYQRGGTYDPIFHGDWEAYDPWEVAGRAAATSDLYNGHAACSIFRMFSGLVALSAIEPGTIRLLPSPKLVTAYFLLRPFFSPRNPPPPPGARRGPEWDAFLAADNWALDREPDSYVHGAVPGHAQRVTEPWHPHLQLRRSMVTLPTLQPGDYILWHPDLAYHITSDDGTGLRGPAYGRTDEAGVLVYVPAAPLTQTNALYLARQRKAFRLGRPGPDFDSAGVGLDCEAPPAERLGEDDVSAVGGEPGLRAMGLAMYDSPGGVQTPEEREAGRMDVDAETKSLGSTSSVSHAEAEVIRLANIILFPDKAMMGFP